MSITDVMNQSGSTTVKIPIANDDTADISRKSLESNITIVTTTHPPVLRYDSNDRSSPATSSPSQVVIMANETNKTQVCVQVQLRLFRR